MKITYDKEVDALNVVLRAGKVAETREISREILLDLDKSGSSFWIEGKAGYQKQHGTFLCQL